MLPSHLLHEKWTYSETYIVTCGTHLSCQRKENCPGACNNYEIPYHIITAEARDNLTKPQRL